MPLSPELVCALSVYRLLTLSRFSLVLRMDGVWGTAMMMKMLSRVLRKRWGTRSTGLTRTWNELWSRSFKCNKPSLLLSWLQIFSVICFFRTSSSVGLVSHAVFWLYTIETDWLWWMWRKWNQQVITSISICNKWALFRSNRCIWFDLRGIRTIYFNECEVKYIEVSKGKLSWDVGKSRSQRWMQVEDSMLNLQLIAFFFND